MQVIITNLTSTTIQISPFTVPGPVGNQVTIEISQADFEIFTGLFDEVRAGRLTFSLPEVAQGNLVAASQDQVYDQPLVAGNHVTAHGIKMPPFIVHSKLKSLSIWSALQANTDTVLVRIYRYRRETATGPFSYTLLNDPFTFNSTYPYSFEVDISANIRSGLSLVPNDQLAVGRVYTAGGSPGMVNLLLKWSVEPLEGTPNELPPPPDAPTWPPA